MRKVFLAVIPMQRSLVKFVYLSEVYPQSSETSYPITILLENECERGDDVVVITLITAGTANVAGQRYPAFKEQVIAILKEKEIVPQFVEIPMNSQLNNDSHQDVYKSIVEQIHDGDSVYTDITYGFKTTPIVIFSALTYVYELKKGVDIAEIVYGCLYDGTEQKEAKLLDVGSLFYLNSLASTLGNMPGDEGKQMVMDAVMK